MSNTYMLAPETSFINKASPLTNNLEMFTCGLCEHIVTPFPRQCADCNNLYCEECVKVFNKFQCPHPNCNSNKSEDVHHSVREILEGLMLTCPGCEQTFLYEAAFEHVKTCPKIKSNQDVDQVSLQRMIAEKMGGGNSKALNNNQMGNLFGTSRLGNQIYVLDREGFSVFVFDKTNMKSIRAAVRYTSSDNIYSFNRTNNSQMLPHNFQLVQIGAPEPTVYMIGGGEFNMNARSLKEIRKLKKRNPGQFEFEECADMIYQRHGHSACSASDKYIVVTGSRLDRAGEKVEIYSIEQNKWSELPSLRTARHYHSSCSFNGHRIFVFCGIQNTTKKYMNTIETLDISLHHSNIVTSWQTFNIKDNNNLLTARQGLGSCQLDADGLLLIGGYTGRFNADSFYLNVQTGELKKTANQMTQDCFPFAVPTVSDPNSRISFTVDWQKYRLFRFDQDQWNIVADFKAMSFNNM